MTPAQAFQHAQALHQAGRAREARAAFERVVHSDPRHAAAWYALGTLAFGARDLARAAECFRHAAAARPDLLEAHGQLGVVLQAQHDHAGAIAAYQAALRLRPDFSALHCNLGNAHHALGDLPAAIAAYREALRLQPDFPEVLNALGVALKASGQLAPAVECYQRAVTLRPGDLSARQNLALALEAQGRLADALAAYDEMLARDPKNIAALANRGALLQAQGQLDAAIAAYQSVLAAQPNHLEALVNLGTALQAKNDLPGALARYREALALQPDLPQAQFNEAVCLLLAGELAAAWPKYEYRWRTEQGKFQRSFPAPLWLGDAPLDGKTLLVHPEQGLGDTLQFVRYVPLLAARGARVVLEVQPPLRALFAGFPGASAVVERGQPLPPFDFHCPILSLPLAFATTLATVPAPRAYLAAPPDRVARWQQKLAATPGPRIGLVWSGGPHHKTDHLRSLPLARFRRLLEGVEARFFSLQKGAKPADAATLAATPAITDLAPEISDFADTAAIITHLDLVISVDTSVAHLAAALGRPTWILLPFAPDWRWLLEREDSPWYPTARLFRQPAPGDWDSVLERIRAELRG